RDWNVRQPGAGHVTRFQPRLPVSGDAALPAQKFQLPTSPDRRSSKCGRRTRPGVGAPYRGRMDVISCKRLTKRFGSAVAVSNLDLDVSAGQVYGFLGPNGAGKTNIGI